MLAIDGRRGSTWLGLFSPPGVNEWQWEDGSLYGGFKDWANDLDEAKILPNERTCAVIGLEPRISGWLIEPCSYGSPFICQVPATAVV